MAKSIILLSDGTGNSASKLFKTNVWRLFQALDLAEPGPDRPAQIACYDDGVGTSSFKPLAILGGAFGWGLKRNVLDLYTFLCRNYAPGDRIYCFGFSRGAFTIRVLTGLINHQGLVQPRSEAKLRRLAAAAFRAYRADRYRTRLGLEHPGRALRDMLVGARDRLMRLDPYRTRAERAKDVPPVAFVGVWDTVAAYGLPIDELTRAWNAFFPLSSPDRELSANVQRACHALALDDERNTFHPVLWNEGRLPQAHAAATHISEERITQVWFAGMHSNVGGGYPEDALAHVSLDWMMTEASRAGLVFKPGEHDRVKAAADCCGKLHDSRHGFGGTYRYLPRKLAALANDTEVARNPVVIERPKIHVSVLERIARSVDGYAPIVLPARYAVVNRSGDILDPQRASARPPALEHPDQAANRARLQEKIWNLVWWRRAAYFGSLAAAAGLATFPAWRSATVACEGPFCGLAPIVSIAGALLPQLATPWIGSYESHPGTFSLLVAMMVALVHAGVRLQVGIFDAMRELWRDILRQPLAPQAPVGPPDDALYRLRTHPLYQRTFRFLKRKALPTIAGAAAGLAILAAVCQGLFAMMSSGGLVCAPTMDRTLSPGRLDRGTFESRALCWASGVSLDAGKRYRITITIDDKAAWRDGDTIGPGIGGFGAELMTPLMYAGLPLRRHLGQPWFKPIARIGETGDDAYPLEPLDGSIPQQSTATLVAEITARRNGELFLYVNDAVLPVPEALQAFYANNKGTATVKVEPAAARP